MAGSMAPVNYVSDDGITYRMRQDASNQVAAGNVASSTVNGLPKRYRPRYILAKHPVSGRERRIVIGSPANAMWVGGTTVITLPDFDATMDPTVYNIAGRIGERRFEA